MTTFERRGSSTDSTVSTENRRGKGTSIGQERRLMGYGRMKQTTFDTPTEQVGSEVDVRGDELHWTRNYNPKFRRRTRTCHWIRSSALMALFVISIATAKESTDWIPRHVRRHDTQRAHMRRVQLGTPPPTPRDVVISATQVSIVIPPLLETSPPTVAPSVSQAPSGRPTAAPSTAPSVSASPTVSAAPSARPSGTPSQRPTVSSAPSTTPSHQPSSRPSISASPTVSAAPSALPSDAPSQRPVLPWSLRAATVTPTRPDFVIVPYSGRLLQGSRFLGVADATEDQSDSLTVTPTMEPTTQGVTELSTLVAPSEAPTSDVSVKQMALEDEDGEPNDDEGDTETEDPTLEPQGDDVQDTLEPTSAPLTDPPVEQPTEALTDPPTGPPIEELPTEKQPTPAPILVEGGTASPTATPVVVPRETPAPAVPQEPPLPTENAACGAYPMCAGLLGDCCPPPGGGLFLECCFLTSPPVDTTPITNAPVPAPETLDPTPSPTVRVTEFPVADPTEPPVAPTTDEPTTPSPTVVPPVTPTASPTQLPSLPPNPLPTTDGPTATPTSAPTVPPTTLSPTDTPSLRPTVSPAPTQSPRPSASPTASFFFEKVSLVVSGVTMNLRRGEARRLQDNTGTNDTDPVNCTQFWHDTVRDRIMTEVKGVIPRFEVLRVSLFNLTSSANGTTLLSMAFDVLIEIRSAVDDHDIDRYIEGPFDTPSEQRTFAETLQLSGCPEFQDITTIEVIVPKTDEQASPNRGVNSAGLIAGIAMATSALVLAGAAFIFMRLRNKGGYYEDENEPINKNAEQHDYGGQDRFDFSSEIDGAHINTDISTLGDPIPAGTSRHNDGDQSTIGSVTLEYDFKKAFMDAQSVTDSQLGDASVDGAPQRSAVATLDDPSLMSDIITTTDDAYGSAFGGEEQFDIVAPAGLLGLILESNPDDGRPTVNIIKPTSVLAHVVNIGDRVISVDGQNVATMRASDVSKLIASKKDQARVLVFNRPNNRSTFRIQENGDEE